MLGVGEGVNVPVGVTVGEDVGDGVGRGVIVPVAVGVGVLVGVDVDVAVEVDVGVPEAFTDTDPSRVVSGKAPALGWPTSDTTPFRIWIGDVPAPAAVKCATNRLPEPLAPAPSGTPSMATAPVVTLPLVLSQAGDGRTITVAEG